jgi:magnesium-transporting ATPase (P-type)
MCCELTTVISKALCTCCAISYHLPHPFGLTPHPQAPHPALAVLEGPQFRALVLQPDGSTDLDAFAALWPHLRVMARCTPADKYTLVQVGGGRE